MTHSACVAPANDLRTPGEKPEQRRREAAFLTASVRLSYSANIAHFVAVRRGGRAPRRVRARNRFGAVVRAGGAALVAGIGALTQVTLAHAESSQVDPTVGYNYSEIETAHHVANAGAQRALSSSVGALFVNPANIARERVYHLGGLAQIWPEARRQSYGLAAVDSVGSSSHIAGAAGVTYNFQDSDGVDRQWTDVRFAMAYPFSDKFSVGLGGRYLWLRQDGLGPFGPSVASGGLPATNIVKTFSFDAGITLRPVPELAIALVGTNLSNPGNGFLPTTVGGGIGFGKSQFALEGDVVADFTSWDRTTVRAMLAANLLLADHYGIRAGYRYDSGAKGHAGALGLAYMDRAFQLELGLRRAFLDNAATVIGMSFTYHLESTGLTPTPGDTF